MIRSLQTAFSGVIGKNFKSSVLRSGATSSSQIRSTVRYSSLSSKEVKKFYKLATISEANGGYEINLDKRKLKTPTGTLFQVPNEPLALAVVSEWNSQVDVIKRSSMHLTTLCNTAIDNPTQRGREVVINGILEFLETDTICYRVDEPPEFLALQRNEWDPLLEWINQRYSAQVVATNGLQALVMPQDTISAFRSHMESHNDWALVGYQQIAEALKSLVLTVCLIDRVIDVERAVALSRLEQLYQISRWGNVEWHHDVEVQETQARVAAGTLFVHLNNDDFREVKHVV